MRLFYSRQQQRSGWPHCSSRSRGAEIGNGKILVIRTMSGPWRLTDGKRMHNSVELLDGKLELPVGSHVAGVAGQKANWRER